MWRIAAKLRYLDAKALGNRSGGHSDGYGSDMPAISTPATISRPATVSGCGTIRDLQSCQTRAEDLSNAYISASLKDNVAPILHPELSPQEPVAGQMKLRMVIRSGDLPRKYSRQRTFDTVAATLRLNIVVVLDRRIDADEFGHSPSVWFAVFESVAATYRHLQTVRMSFSVSAQCSTLAFARR
jgi:hypothetical protein